MEYKALTLADKLEEIFSPRLNPDVWIYAGAGYGSQAYQALGIEEETAAFEREAEMWG